MTFENVWTKDEQKDHRRLWIVALRSGEYKQIKFMMHKSETFFCALGLGVYVMKKHLSLNNILLDNDESIFNNCKFYGLRTPIGLYNNNTNSIMSDNDFDRKTFSQIADIIESEPEGLLKK